MLILIVVCWIIGGEFDDGFAWSFSAELLIVDSGIVVVVALLSVVVAEQLLTLLWWRGR